MINHLETQARANLRLIQKVVGHRLKAGDIGITERYIGKYPTATLRDEVIAVLPWAEQLPLALLTESRWAGK